MKHLRHVDGNQVEIVAALRSLGYGVIDLSMVGGGCADLLCASPDGNRLWLLEVKNPNGRNRIDPSQRAFAERFPAPVHVVRSVDEALAAVGVAL